MVAPLPDCRVSYELIWLSHAATKKLWMDLDEIFSGAVALGLE